MCRLYAQISPKALTAGDFLAESDRSLLKQANYRKGDFQQDGWGVGWFSLKNGRRAQLVKSPKAVFKEEPRFKALVRKVSSRIVIGHLRAASNPMRLSQKQLMRAENAQPFTDGRFVFAHNGTVQIPKEVLKFLGPYKDKLQGSNDSEIYFWQFRKFYDLYGDVPQALEACVRELWTLWEYRTKAQRGKKKAPYLGLNTLVSDGDALYAMCCFPPKHPKKSLFNPKAQWGRMNSSFRDGRFIVASEELDQGSWTKFGSAEIVSAAVKNGKVAVRRRVFTPGPA